jgi:prophage regulatory protein
LNPFLDAFYRVRKTPTSAERFDGLATGTLSSVATEQANNHSAMTVRLLSKKELRAIVLYSPAHIDRLEKAGLFPKRVSLGPCRVGWIESEVIEWLEQRIRMRDEPATQPSRSIK